jgi:hypothetical protein
MLFRWLSWAIYSLSGGQFMPSCVYSCMASAISFLFFIPVLFYELEHLDREEEGQSTLRQYRHRHDVVNDDRLMDPDNKKAQFQLFHCRDPWLKIKRAGCVSLALFLSPPAFCFCIASIESALLSPSRTIQSALRSLFCVNKTSHSLTLRLVLSPRPTIYPLETPTRS